MTRESWIDTNVKTTAEMISYCPAFWEICGIDPGDLEGQSKARRHTKEGNVLYFGGEADAEDPNIPDNQKLVSRKRKSREDWINVRPLATVMHDTETYEIGEKGTGVFLPAGLIDVVLEKNVFDENGQLIGDGEMPSEEASNEWISQIANLMEEIGQISIQNRIPLSDPPVRYPKGFLPFFRMQLNIPPQFSTLVENRIYGPHFIASINLFYSFGKR